MTLLIRNRILLYSFVLLLGLFSSFSLAPYNFFYINFFLEFDKMWIHGYLHLIGYDHKKLNDFNKMLRKEKLILKYFHKVN